jgi:hypothetical protein
LLQDLAAGTEKNNENFGKFSDFLPVYGELISKKKKGVLTTICPK